MPGVSTKISVLDAATPAIEHMYRGVSQLISGMYKLNQATSNAIDMSPFLEAQKSMAEAVAVQRQMENEYQRMASGAQQAQAAQNAYTGSINSSDNAQRRHSMSVGQVSTSLRQLNSTAKNLINIQKQIENEYNRMRQSVSQVEAVQTQLNNNIGEVPALQKQVISQQEQMLAEYRQIKEYTEQANTAQRQYNNSISQGVSNATALGDRLTSSIKRYITMAAGAYSGKQLIDASDTWINNSVRLGLITDNLQQQNVLQQQIYRSAKEARGAYSDTVDVVAKLGLLTGDAFSSNTEIVKFTELMNKSFKLSGASTQEKTAAMYQLTQAMASGRLQGDEFRSIIENAPMLANAIAEYTGVGREGLKDLSSDGAISAEIIKNSLFSVADDIESKFSTLPMTFGDVWTNTVSDATMAFGPLYEQMNDMLNSDFGQGIVSGLSEDIEFVAEQIQDMMNWGMRLAENVVPDFSNVEVAIEDIITDFTRFRGVAYDVVSDITNVFSSKGASTSIRIFANNLFNIAEAGSAIAKTLSPALPVITSVYIGFKNYKMLSGIFSPVVKGAQDTFNHLQEVKDAYNDVKMATEGVKQATDVATNSQRAYNLATASNVILGIASAVLSIASAWKSVTDETNNATRAAILEHQASAGYIASQDTIKASEYAKANGVDMDTARIVVGIKENYQAQRDAVYQESYDKYIEDSSQDYFDFVREMDRKKEIINAEEEREIQEALAFKKQAAELEKMMKELEKDSGTGGYDGTDIDNVENVNHINDTVDIASEDLRYMRELAEQEAINQFTNKLLQPQINVTFGEVKETADVDAITKRITDGLIESLNNSGDVVHI